MASAIAKPWSSCAGAPASVLRMSMSRVPGGIGSRSTAASGDIGNLCYNIDSLCQELPQRSVLSIPSLRRRSQLRSVVSDSVLEHDLHVFDISDARRGIALRHEDVRALPHLDRPGRAIATEVDRAVERRNFDRLDRSEARLDEHLD